MIELLLIVGLFVGLFLSLTGGGKKQTNRRPPGCARPAPPPAPPAPYGYKGGIK